jgi:hypothetical protein
VRRGMHTGQALFPLATHLFSNHKIESKIIEGHLLRSYLTHELCYVEGYYGARPLKRKLVWLDFGPMFDIFSACNFHCLY